MGDTYNLLDQPQDIRICNLTVTPEHMDGICNLTVTPEHKDNICNLTESPQDIRTPVI